MQEIEKDQIFLTGLTDQLEFYYSRGKGHFLGTSWNRFQWYWFPRFRLVAYFASHIKISTHCNMQCPMCYRRTEKFKSRVEPRFMQSKIFEKIIEECAKYKLFSIRLSLSGDSFIHPNIFEFIEIAKKAALRKYLHQQMV